MEKYKLFIFTLALLAGTAHAQKAKTVVLTFDDAPQSHFSFVAPLLKKYGFGATFYVCEFPGVYPDSSKAMNWRQIAALSKMGFEIGNHTQHHALLTKDNEAELIYVDRKCDSVGIPKPVSYAYPSYNVDSSSFAVLRKYGYTSARIGGDQPYDKKMDDPYLVPSFTIHDKSIDLFYKPLEQRKESEVIVFTFHGVPDDPHPWVSTSREKFVQLLDYLKQHRYKVIAMRDLKLKHGGTN